MGDPNTLGRQFAAAQACKTTFRDAHERRAYVRAVEIAAHIVDHPESIARADLFLERHVRPDPHQARYYRLWKTVIALDPERIAAALLEDSDRGAELRSSAPVFVVLDRQDQTFATSFS